MIEPVGKVKSPASNTQALDSSSIQGYPSQGNVVPHLTHLLPLIESYTTGGHSRFFAPHPISGMMAELEQDGTVLKVYGPPLDLAVPYSAQFSRVMVPQSQSGTPQKGWEQKPSVLFFMWERLGVSLSDALQGKIGGIDYQGSFPLEGCGIISIKLHFPGYDSSTQVEKRLKRRHETDGGDKARSMLICTRINGVPVTEGKLVEEVSKRIQWYIRDLEDNKDLFPFDSGVGEQWSLGHGRMKPEHMIITRLDNISPGCWLPVIYIGLDSIEIGVTTPS